MKNQWELKRIDDPRKPAVLLAILTLQGGIVTVENKTVEDIAEQFAAGISATDEKVFYPKDGEKFIAALQVSRELSDRHTLTPVE